MPETESTPGRGKRLMRSLSAKLILLLLSALVVTFAVLGYVNIRLHRQHLEAAALTSAERVSDVIKRSTAYSMLRNDREGLHHQMRTMADEPGMVHVRIFDQEGRIKYSTEPSEINHIVDKGAEACYACHSQSQPLAKLDRPDRFRIYRNGGGSRVLGIISPIENQPACSNAECHAHPASQQILGVLDTSLSLAKADAQLAESTDRMLAYMIFAMIAIAVLSWIFVWRVVGVPVKALKSGTEHLAGGDLGYQINVQFNDEVGELSHSFNKMSLELRAANEEIVAWARTLEERVEQKTRELKRAHEHMLHVEKMASIGKMAAVVAHEINNPLSGILTYAKLLRKWMEAHQTNGAKHQESIECLELIAAESRRCGELVRNLLTFSRTSPMNVEPADLNKLLQQCVMLLRHNLEMAGIQLHEDLAADLPLVQCDVSQIEQMLLAIMVNAIDAMARGGNLWLESHAAGGSGEVEIKIRDDGAGIPPEVLPDIFEPFFTTKERGRGTGLGLAVSRSIAERHSGNIAIESEVGKGTTVTITLPAPGGTAAPKPALAGAEAKSR